MNSGIKKKPPIRILFPFVGDTVGGSHLSALNLIGALNREEFEPIVAVHQEGMLIQYLQDRGMPFARPPGTIPLGNNSKTNKIDMLRYIVRLAFFLRKNRIKIVHTNDGRMHLMWGMAARLAGIRFVMHQRSTLKSGTSKNLLTILPHKILTISEYCKASFPEKMRQRAQIVVNPFNTTSPPPDRVKARQAFIDKLGCSNDTRVVGFVSNLIDHKRPQVFVEMAAVICKSGYSNIIFPMFGDKREPVIGKIETLIESRGLQSKCILMGPRFPIEPWMAACDVLVAPAVKEGFGRTLVESMLVGTPVIAADKGGHKEIIEHGVTGLLVEPDDPDAFAEAVIKILEDPLLSKTVSESARLWALDRCSASQHANAIQQVYWELLS